jgi:uncharacterized protein YjiS (DUF1127 family)
MSIISLRAGHGSFVGLSAASASGRSPRRTRLIGVVDRLLTWQERARQRRQLQGLSDQMLRDIGLGRADVQAEASKPFWRP